MPAGVSRISKRAVFGFMAAIFAVGSIRFGLTVAGAPDEIAKYASMTLVIAAGCVYFGATQASARALLGVSYLLILPYIAVELAGIGYTWATGRTTIFHVPQYSFGLPVHVHFWGHLVGGLTWEPLGVFVMMLVVRAVSGRLISSLVRSPAG